MSESKSTSSTSTSTSNADNRTAAQEGAIAAQNIDGGVVIEHTSEGAFDLVSETVDGAFALARDVASNSFASVGEGGVVVPEGSEVTGGQKVPGISNAVLYAALALGAAYVGTKVLK